MLYEIHYEVNWAEESKMVRAGSETEALRRFKEQWEEHGDVAPAEPWVAGCWAER